MGAEKAENNDHNLTLEIYTVLLLIIEREREREMPYVIKGEKLLIQKTIFRTLNFIQLLGF